MSPGDAAIVDDSFVVDITSMCAGRTLEVFSNVLRGVQRLAIISTTLR